MREASLFEAAASQGQLVLCISADAALADFAIEDLSGGLSLRDFRAGLSATGRLFVGLVTVSNGAPNTLLDVELPADVTETLATACVAHINSRFDAAMRSVGMPPVGLPATKECA